MIESLIVTLVILNSIPVYSLQYTQQRIAKPEVGRKIPARIGFSRPIATSNALISTLPFR